MITLLLVAIFKYTNIHDIQESDDHPDCMYHSLGLLLSVHLLTLPAPSRHMEKSYGSVGE